LIDDSNTQRARSRHGKSQAFTSAVRKKRMISRAGLVGNRPALGCFCGLDLRRVAGTKRIRSCAVFGAARPRGTSVALRPYSNACVGDAGTKSERLRRATRSFCEVSRVEKQGPGGRRLRLGPSEIAGIRATISRRGAAKARSTGVSCAPSQANGSREMKRIRKKKMRQISCNSSKETKNTSSSGHPVLRMGCAPTRPCRSKTGLRRGSDHGCLRDELSRREQVVSFVIRSRGTSSKREIINGKYQGKTKTHLPAFFLEDWRKLGARREPRIFVASDTCGGCFFSPKRPSPFRRYAMEPSRAMTVADEGDPLVRFAPLGGWRGLRGNAFFTAVSPGGHPSRGRKTGIPYRLFRQPTTWRRESRDMSSNLPGVFEDQLLDPKPSARWRSCSPPGCSIFSWKMHDCFLALLRRHFWSAGTVSPGGRRSEEDQRCPPAGRRAS